MSLMRIALWGPLLVAALLLGGYIYMHDPFARDGTELLQVPLSEEDPTLDRVGDLRYLGGLDIPRMEQNIGGLSGLRWDSDSGRLLAITDDARWVWFTLWEEKNRLFGIEKTQSGSLLGLEGERLVGKENGDSESLTRSPDGEGWMIGFERDHRVWLYDDVLGEARPSALDPSDLFDVLDENNGLEAMADGPAGQLTCAERKTGSKRANCVIIDNDTGAYSDLPAIAPTNVARRGAVPTDADALSDGTFLILFRSYSPAEGNAAAVVAYTPDGAERDVAAFLPPLTVDNFEGLAVREEGEGAEKRTFLYIVSDDNFSGSQRTLLMKFELDLADVR